MAQGLRRILVAIGDLARAPRAELRKAGALARASGASIELFHSIVGPEPGSVRHPVMTDEAILRFRAAHALRQRQRLERLARRPDLRGIAVTCTTTWDYPPHEAIVRRALETHADLVIAATRHHRFGARLLLTNTDWELIRQCPAPLLLVKSPRQWLRPAVLTAVDPFHAHARPADLDARLLRSAGAFARLLHGSLHVFHSYMPLVTTLPVPVTAAPVMMLPPEAEEAHGQEIERVINRLAAAAGVTRARRHIHMGEVAEELRAAARETHAGLVVMGAVSRSGLARLFIGNTAERVLERLPCDILVVKPRGFRSKVIARRRMGVTTARV
jgi:universal stress protein E